MNKQALYKTFSRTRRFVVEGLLWRGEARCYALVVWALLAGLLWVAINLSIDSAAVWLLLPWQLFLVASLAAVAAIDARFAIIPDPLIGALLLGGVLHVAVEGARGVGGLADASDALTLELGVIGWRGGEGLIAFGGAALLRGGYRVLRGRDGFGFGDVKFIGAAALWVGVAMVPLMLIVAVLSALGTVVLLRRQVGPLGGGDAIPFGPHLSVGLWLTVLMAGEIGTSSW
ncbi:prepilin peptidase [Bradyrhizobium ganzhouense]|uniref:prepilin peptidase n=1 Tax=Bradyrhizobium ganzhouense TaxID=1179767 RepID=UPI003CF2ABC8